MQTFLKDLFTKGWMLIVPLLLVLFVALALYATEHKELGLTVSLIGTVTTLFGNLAFILLWDSKKRWLNTSFLDRLGRLFTFAR